MEIRCPGCGRTLRIPDEHAGKQIRCPACQQISTASDPRFPIPDPVVTTWHLRTPEGQTYGPLEWRQIENWAAEGRISADCELSTGQEGPWQPAGERLPHLLASTGIRAAAQPEPAMHPWASQPLSGANPYSAPAASLAPWPVGGYVAPHRGGLIFVLGLLGFVVGCPIFSLLAWVMGSRDLREMNAGRMDRTGEGLTRAGQILGIILSVLTLLGCGLSLLVILLAALGANW